MKVGIQGQAGSFHQQAAEKFYGKNAHLVHHASFADLFDAYASGEIDAIVVAIENSLFGAINDVYRLIEICEAPIIGEVKLPIRHMLIAHPTTVLADISEVYSQSIALNQCHDTLSHLLPGVELVDYFDTAAAVEYIASLDDSSHVAAIASQRASEIHNMSILKQDVQDDPSNTTRFLVLENRDAPADANKSSLIITTDHKPGALAEVLNIFAKNQVNLSTIHSHPIADKPFEYKFFIDVDVAGDKLRTVVAEIEKLGHEVVLLGEYRADWSPNYSLSSDVPSRSAMLLIKTSRGLEPSAAPIIPCSSISSIMRAARA